jgi:hypothetical protein
VANRIKHSCCLFPAIFFTMNVFSNLLLPHKAVAEEVLPPWSRDGERFRSYSFFRDELTARLLAVKSRAAVVTPLFADADIATALFTLRLKGLAAMAIVDSQQARNFRSRHEYLARATVPVHLVSFGQLEKTLFRSEPGPQSFVVMDQEVWRINQTLSEGNTTDLILEPARFTADEVWNWQWDRSARKVPMESSANKSTSGAAQPREASVTIEKVTRNVRSGGPIPRKLPRETRLQKLGKGQAPRTDEQESTGSTLVPPPPANETDVFD